MAKGASEDKLAHLSISWRRTPGSPLDCLPAAMDDRLPGEKRAMGGSTEIRLIVVVVVLAVVVVVVVLVVVVGIIYRVTGVLGSALK